MGKMNLTEATMQALQGKSLKEDISNELDIVEIEDAILKATQEILDQRGIDYKKYTNPEMKNAVKFDFDGSTFVVSVNEMDMIDTQDLGESKNIKTESEDLSYRDSDCNRCRVYYAVNSSGYTSLGLVVNDKDKKFQIVYGPQLGWGHRTAKKSKKQIWEMAKDLYENGYEEVRGPSSVVGSVKDESKNIKTEDKSSKKYNNFTFIPVGNVRSNLNSFDYIEKNSKLDKEFDADNGTYDYDEFYQIMPPIDVFEIKELNNIRVMPGSRVMFEYTGNNNTIIPVSEYPSEEELKKPDANGYIGMSEDKEVIADLLDVNKNYNDISYKYGYSFNDYQLYNIATLYIVASAEVKSKIEDLLEDINYHRECAEIKADAYKFKSNLFESKNIKTEATPNKLKLSGSDKNILKMLGYPDDDMRQIEEALNETIYTVADVERNDSGGLKYDDTNVKVISAQEAREILGDGAFLAALSRSAFHFTTGRYNTDKTLYVSFDSSKLFFESKNIKTEARNTENDEINEKIRKSLNGSTKYIKDLEDAGLEVTQNENGRVEAVGGVTKADLKKANPDMDYYNYLTKKKVVPEVTDTGAFTPTNIFRNSGRFEKVAGPARYGSEDRNGVSKAIPKRYKTGRKNYGYDPDVFPKRDYNGVASYEPLDNKELNDFKYNKSQVADGGYLKQDLDNAKAEYDKAKDAYDTINNKVQNVRDKIAKSKEKSVKTEAEESSSFLNNEINVYDIDAYVKKVGGEKYQTMEYQSGAAIFTENGTSGKFVMADYEAVGFHGDDTSKEFKLGIATIPEDEHTIKIFPEYEMKTSIKEIMETIQPTKSTFADFFTRRNYNSRCENNFAELVESLKEIGVLDENAKIEEARSHKEDNERVAPREDTHKVQGYTNKNKYNTQDVPKRAIFNKRKADGGINNWGYYDKDEMDTYEHGTADIERYKEYKEYADVAQNTANMWNKTASDIVRRKRDEVDNKKEGKVIKTESNELTWDDIYTRAMADDVGFGHPALKAKDNMRYAIEQLMEKEGVDIENSSDPEVDEEAYADEHKIKFDAHGNIISIDGKDFR